MRSRGARAGPDLFTSNGGLYRNNRDHTFTHIDTSGLPQYGRAKPLNRAKQPIWADLNNGTHGRPIERPSGAPWRMSNDC